jgi:hypothetical protein
MASDTLSTRHLFLLLLKVAPVIKKKNQDPSLWTQKAQILIIFTQNINKILCTSISSFLTMKQIIIGIKTQNQIKLIKELS